MIGLQNIVGRSLSVGVGATLLLAGCASRQPVTLSGNQVVPPVATTATGTSNIAVNGYKNVYGSVATSGIAATAAHIHQGAPGQTGPPIVTLEKKSDNVWQVPTHTQLTDAQYAAYANGDLYVNVHSDAHKAGEIRAQLKP
jgi:hypothetical protein